MNSAVELLDTSSPSDDPLLPLFTVHLVVMLMKDLIDKGLYQAQVHISTNCLGISSFLGPEYLHVSCPIFFQDDYAASESRPVLFALTQLLGSAFSKILVLTDWSVPARLTQPSTSDQLYQHAQFVLQQNYRSASPMSVAIDIGTPLVLLVLYAATTAVWWALSKPY